MRYGKLHMQVYEMLLTIPRGKVVTYGGIAAALGNPRLARVVGNILHVNPAPDHYPCYKVVNARGKIADCFAFGGADAQNNRLAEEGIEVVNGYVDLKHYGWSFPPQKSESKE